MQTSSPLTFTSVTRFIYIHNPFYLLSALLVLLGLHEAFAAELALESRWLLLGMICGYTVLLAAAAFVIIRFGQVWEDARTILLVIVLMFFALSVSFDRVVLESPQVGARFLLLGLAFSIAMSEAVLRSLAIRLRPGYRVPYYLVLVLLFTYPLALGQLSIDGHEPAMTWGVFLFPAASALVLLSLWSAARVPRDHEPPNGTPWTWPAFPWSLFIFLLLAIGLRSYSLSVAFEATKGFAVSFQPYFLAPLVFVAAILLLEVGIANAHRPTQLAALLLPVTALLLSLPGSDLSFVAARFLAMLSADVGSPAQLAVAGMGVFYAFAWLRGHSLGEIGLFFSAALAGLVDRHTVDVTTFASFQPLPLAAIAALELINGLTWGSSWRVMVGALAIALATVNIGSPTSMHSAMILLLALGAIYNDRWAQIFRQLMLPALPAAALVTALGYELFFPEIPRVYHAVLIASLVAIAGLYWRRSPDMPQMLATLICFLALLLWSARELYLALEFSPLRRGLPLLAAGIGALTVALMLSFAKGVLIARGWRTLRALNKA